MKVHLEDVQATLQKYDGKPIPKSAALALLQTTGFFEDTKSERKLPSGHVLYTNKFDDSLFFQLPQRGGAIEGTHARTLRATVLRALPFASAYKARIAAQGAESNTPDTEIKVRDATDSSPERDLF